MAKYYPVFKCMICGELIQEKMFLDKSIIEAREQVAAAIRRYQMFGNAPHISNIPWFATHVCKDGSIGIAEFAGLKKE